MCGIFGIFRPNDSTIPAYDRLEQSAQLLAHRGPDNVSIHCEEGLGLVHTRLSLLDLSESGNQPFWDASHRFCLVYNGEIYNFQELRSQMEKVGGVFHTKCDTEVLLNGILHFGLDAFLPQLQGMFAFALWDREEGSLTLVRDRFGIKPLSILVDDDFVIFSSEVKAMGPWIPLEPSREAIYAYLAGFGGSTRDHSFYARIELVAPGSVIKISRKECLQRKYFFRVLDFWDPEYRESLHRQTSAQIVDDLDERMTESVKRHLVADAPVGAFCSGGIDSSLVMAMAARVHPNLAIFHANVKGPLSEYDAASQLAGHLNLEMKSVDVSDRDFIEFLPKVIWHYEYPCNYHPNSVPFFLVARLVHENGVKAVLSGEGSDECFLGYGSIAYDGLRHTYQQRMEKVRRVIQRIPRIGKALWPEVDGRQTTVLALLRHFEREDDEMTIREHVEKVSGKVMGSRESRSLVWLSYHLRTLLHRNDVLGMASSIEARFPFLDHDVVRLAVNMPYATKIRRSITSLDRSHPFIRDKWALREVANRYLPKNLSQRRKQGFPTNAYARLEIAPRFLADSLLNDILNLSSRECQLLTEASPSDFQVRLLFLDLWAQLYFAGLPIDAVQERLARAVTIRAQ